LSMNHYKTLGGIEKIIQLNDTSRQQGSEKQSIHVLP